MVPGRVNNLPFSHHRTRPSATSPQLKKPSATGKTVPLNCCPINAPRDAARAVRTKVWNDDAAPATWPKGVIAIDEKFEPINPIIAILPVSSTMKIGSEVGTKVAASNCKPPSAIKVSRAVCDTRRAPKR